MNRITLELPPLPHYVTIGRTRYLPGEQHPSRRNIGIFDWLFVIRGTLHIGEDEKTWAVGQGQALLLFPDRSHYAVAPCTEETEFFWIHFEFPGVCASSPGEHAPFSIRHAWSNPYRLELGQYTVLRRFSGIERLLHQMAEQEEASSAALYWRQQQRFMDLLHYMEEEGRERHTSEAVLRLAERTEAYLRQHYRKELSNEALADALHFHANYIVRCMKEIYRCTPMEYLHKIRMEQAKSHLIKTEWSIADIAANTGFNYAPYFSNSFKRYTGMTPQAFRKLHAD